MNKPDQAPAVADPADPPAASTPVPVKIARTEENPIRSLMDLLTPITGPLGNTVMVIVIVIFMLLAGSDLRDRLIHLLVRKPPARHHAGA